MIHQTAKEFLVAKGEVITSIWKHSLDPVESELVIAKTCIIYLMVTDFDFAIQERIENHSYLSYATQFWVMHYQKAQERADSKIIQSVIEICDPQSRRLQTWILTY